MSPLRNLKLTALMASSLTAGCITDADLGNSAFLDVEGRQSLIGAFRYDSRPALADFNGDGFDDLAVWTSEGQPWDGLQGFLGAPPNVYLYYGREGGLPEELGPEDADAALAIRTSEYVALVMGQDLDGDGAAELIVHAAVDGWRSPSAPVRGIAAAVEGSVYVVPGGTTLDGSLTLESIGSRVPSYPVAGELPVPIALAHEDLDGLGGAEYVTQPPYGEWADMRTAVYVRSLDTGALRATLTLPAHGTIDARAVFDFDGDGHADVLAFYALMPAETGVYSPREWTEFGVGVFYGPITGDLTLRDPGTDAIQIPNAYLVFNDGGPESFAVGGGVRAVVGRFTADSHRDLLLATSRSPIAVFVGGARVSASTYPFGIASTDYQNHVPHEERWTELAATVPGRAAGGNDAMFLLGERALAVVTPQTSAALSRVEGVTHNSTERTTGEDSPYFSEGGAAIGDIDGDGKLEVVLGTRPPEGEEASRVHILYGFGG